MAFGSGSLGWGKPAIDQGLDHRTMDRHVDTAHLTPFPLSMLERLDGAQENACARGELSDHQTYFNGMEPLPPSTAYLGSVADGGFKPVVSIHTIES
jgi:hypothetical protein